MTSAETYALEYETKVEKLKVRFKLYGVSDELFNKYNSACILKAVSTVYSYFDLMEMLLDDHTRYGEPNLSIWILND